MKRKISRIALLRLAIQLLFFFLLPGLVAETFHGFQVIIDALFSGSIDAFFWQQILSTGLVVLGTLFLGRFFCGWMCAFGTLGDLFHLLGSKVFRTHRKMNESLDAWLKAIKYVVLVFIVAAIWIGGLSWFDTWSPWDALGMLNSLPPDFVYTFTELTIGASLLVIFMLGSLFIERFFCRYFCPLGAVLSILSFLRIGKIKKPGKACGKCKVCTNHCAMGIGLYHSDIVQSGECIDCMQCISPCPRKNVNFTVAAVDATPFAAAVAAVSVMGLYYGGNTAIAAFTASTDTTMNELVEVTVSEDTTEATSPEQPRDTAPPQVQEPTSESAEPNTEAVAENSSGYIDGTYEGSGTGYKGRTTTVSVTIKNGNIASIETVSTGDDGPYYNRSFPSVSSQITDTQETSVDAVSGATYSSNGIMSAVDDALSKAKR